MKINLPEFNYDHRIDADYCEGVIEHADRFIAKWPEIETILCEAIEEADEVWTRGLDKDDWLEAEGPVNPYLTRLVDEFIGYSTTPVQYAKKVKATAERELEKLKAAA